MNSEEGPRPGLDEGWLAGQSSQALRHMLGGDEDGASDAVLRVAAREGWSGFLYLSCYCVDQMVRRCFPQVHQDPGLLTGFRVVDSGTGEQADVEAIDPDERWAMRWIQARATMDIGNQEALWRVMEASPEGAAARIRSVLISTAANIAAAAGVQVAENISPQDWFGTPR